jgi:hypothetical protein
MELRAGAGKKSDENAGRASLTMGSTPRDFVFKEGAIDSSTGS